MKRGKWKRWLVIAFALAMGVAMNNGGAQPIVNERTMEMAEESGGAEDATLAYPEEGLPGMEEAAYVPLPSMALRWVRAENNTWKLGYVVQYRDTMWDIAGRYLNSPYYWPKIWERSSATIINPHLIFPGDILFLFPEVVVEQPMIEVEDESHGPGGPPVIRYQTMGSTGFISREELEGSGMIVDNRHHKKLLGEYDLVYVNVGKRVVVPGDRYTIFRMLKSEATGNVVEITHPVTGDTVGYQIVNLGVLEITKVQADVSEAEILVSFIEIYNGDRITPYLMPLDIDVTPVRTKVDLVKGYIINSKTNVRLIGENDIVYIDVGAEQQVVRGNIFDIYRPCEYVQDTMNNKVIRIPQKVIGQLVVVETRPTTSVALVVNTLEEVVPGDRILMSRFNRWEIEDVSKEDDIQSCRTDSRCQLITREEYEAGRDNPYCDPVDKETAEKEKEDTKYREKYKFKD